MLGWDSRRVHAYEQKGKSLINLQPGGSDGPTISFTNDDPIGASTNQLMAFITLFAGIFTTIVLSDFLLLFLGFAKHFPKITTAGTAVAHSRISRVPHKRHPYMHQVYDSGELIIVLTKMYCDYFAFPFSQQGQRSQFVISEFNTEPIHSSAKA